MKEEKILQELFFRLHISKKHQASIKRYLNLLGKKSEDTKRHCIRVAHNGVRFGMYCDIPGVNIKVLFWACVLHDLGKIRVRPELLDKKRHFTKKDYEEVKHHVRFGWQMLRKVHAWTAYIIIGHHRFGPNPYPKLPPLPKYLRDKKDLINTYRRLVALADYYDALMFRRDNEKFGKKSSSAERREQYVHDNADQLPLIEKLERANVLVF